MDFPSKKFLGSIVFLLLFVFSAFAVAAEDGLVAHYAFEGDLQDSTGNFLVGQPIGNRIGSSPGVVTSQVGNEFANLEFVEGVEGLALKFDGSSGVLLPPGLIQSDSYTISLLINPKTVSQHTTTFFGAVSGNKWISIVPDGPTTHYTMLWSGENWFDATASFTIPVNEWSHFVATVDQGQVTVYINGKQEFTGVNFPSIFSGFSGDAVFALGVNWWDTPFNGILDELKIYDRALTADEIVK